MVSHPERGRESAAQQLNPVTLPPRLVSGRGIRIHLPAQVWACFRNQDFLDSLQLRLSHGHSVMLAGPRRTGKTSIAFEILRRLEEKGFYTAFVDTFRIAEKRELALTLIDACLRNRTGLLRTTEALKDRLKRIAGSAKLAVKLHDLEISLGFPDPEQDDYTLFDYALELPDRLAKADGKKMVVVFDKFQDAGHIGRSGIYKVMRSYFQTHENHL